MSNPTIKFMQVDLKSLALSYYDWLLWGGWGGGEQILFFVGKKIQLNAAMKIKNIKIFQKKMQNKRDSTNYRQL